MKEEGDGRQLLEGLRDGEDRLLLSFGAHTRRRFIDNLLWPNDGCFEL
jgi:hypothetical protein